MAHAYDEAQNDFVQVSLNAIHGGCDIRFRLDEVMVVWPEPKIAPRPAGAEEADETGDADTDAAPNKKRGKPKGDYWPYLVKLFQNLNQNAPGAFNTPNGSQKNVSQLMGDVRKKWDKSWPRLPKKTALRTAINDALKLIDMSPA